jgi:hypothetical protein
VLVLVLMLVLVMVLVAKSEKLHHSCNLMWRCLSET